MEAFCIKTQNSALVPATDHDREILKVLKMGQPVKITIRRVRNYDFHKKYFALLNYAFEIWEPPEHGAGSAWKEKMVIEKNFDRFRKDIIIRAGFYEATYRLNGDVRFEAKSISFHNMSEEEFADLYALTLDVIIKHVLTGYTEETLKEVLAHIEGFE